MKRMNLTAVLLAAALMTGCGTAKPVVEDVPLPQTESAEIQTTAERITDSAAETTAPIVTEHETTAPTVTEKANTAAEEETEETEFYMEFIGGGAGSFDVTDQIGNPSLNGRTLTYTGEPVEAVVCLNQVGVEDVIEELNVTFFLLNEGIPQPFSLDGGEPSLFVTVPYPKEEQDRDHFYNVQFQPSNVPYGDTSCLALFAVVDEACHFQVNTMFAQSCLGTPFYLTADSEEHAVSWQAEMPVWGEKTKFDWNPSRDSATLGVAITKPLTSLDQLRMNTAFHTTEPLTACFTSDYATEMEFFAFVDGRPAPLFNGSWYCSLQTEKNTLYELPVDMDVIPKGDHCIYVVPLNMNGSAPYTSAYCKQKTELRNVIESGYVYDVVIE